MATDPIGDDVRTRNREKRHGTGATCVRCGESELVCLTQAPERLVEQHHVCGKNHDADLVIPLCQNCHLKLHEEMRRAGVDLRGQPTDLEQLAEILRCLSVLLPDLGATLAKWADRAEQIHAERPNTE